jgi:hypothetical protein
VAHAMVSALLYSLAATSSKVPTLANRTA